MAVIVGLDVSLCHTGWCRIDTENGSRTFDTLDHSKLRDMLRISTAARDLVDLCRPADLVVMEGLSMGIPSHGGGAAFVPQGRIDLIGLTYVVRLWLYKAQRECLLVPPSTLKKFASGKGNSQKNQMLHAVAQRWSVEPGDDNQADAIALAEFGRAYLAQGEPGQALPDFQSACLPKAAKLFTAAA